MRNRKNRRTAARPKRADGQDIIKYLDKVTLKDVQKPLTDKEEAIVSYVRNAKEAADRGNVDKAAEQLVRLNRYMDRQARYFVLQNERAEDALTSAVRYAEDYKKTSSREFSGGLDDRAPVSLTFDEIKQELETSTWDYSVDRRRKQLTFHGKADGARIYYDDQTGVEPGWVFQWSDGDAEPIDTVGDLRDALANLGVMSLRSSRDLCASCRREEMRRREATCEGCGRSLTSTGEPEFYSAEGVKEKLEDIAEKAERHDAVLRAKAFVNRNNNVELWVENIKDELPETLKWNVRWEEKEMSVPSGKVVYYGEQGGLGRFMERELQRKGLEVPLPDHLK